MTMLAIFFEILSEFVMVRVRLSATPNVKELMLAMFLETPTALDLMLLPKLTIPIVLGEISFLFFDTLSEFAMVRVRLS